LTISVRVYPHRAQLRGGHEGEVAAALTRWPFRGWHSGERQLRGALVSLVEFVHCVSPAIGGAKLD
jgi:hypothetical protein